ncbi:hypothetical protein G6F37_003371 [Rhizopus arrhizus]|nr:hypothetical protein G6F38_003041 [Rhizopus arrhizus]KAG1161106.1 hypothetical protein G6F37_003371 [Rhizopus arrhizus]
MDKNKVSKRILTNSKPGFTASSLSSRSQHPGNIISSAFMFTDRIENYIYFSDTDRVIVRTMDGTTINFHNSDPDYLIYVGERNCQRGFTSDCHSEAFYSKNNGRIWIPISTYVRSCFWGRGGGIKDAHHDSILCEQHQEQLGNQLTLFDSSVQLVSSENYFHEKRILFDNIIGITIFGRYMVAAVPKGGGMNLRLFVSMDGNNFAPASFPANFGLSPEVNTLYYKAFTIMESVDSLWIHVTTNVQRGSEYGTIFTSNSNGTYYVDSLKNVNRNEMGIVDFEKMQGIEGISIANTVTNPGQVNRGDHKKLSTHITVDAGAHWHKIEAPKRDSNGDLYICPPDTCFLNLHCYSERQNPHDLFSLSSAVGLMVGVGNVGGHLTDYRDGNMFLTRDAGKTWIEIAKGAHLWEFADQGSLLVLADNKQPTNSIKYTTNEGLTWATYEFTTKDNRMIIEDIITQPDGTSQKYVLFGLKGGKTVAIHIDFSPLRPNKCVLDLDHPNDDDFELWSPENTRGEKCLFGHESVYHRRIRDHDCYIGEKLVQPKEIVRDCTCTEEDYECDYNYVRDSSNNCTLVHGLLPLVPTCDNSIDFYYTPSGYRKVAASTCRGGLELDKLGEKIMCPSIKGLGDAWTVLFISAILSVGLVFGILYYRKHAGFGRIYLPDSVQQVRSNILSSSVTTKLVKIAVAIPTAITGTMSRITLPRFLSDITDMIKTTLLPSYFTRSGGNENARTFLDEQTDILLQDHNSDECLIDNVSELDGFNNT